MTGPDPVRAGAEGRPRGRVGRHRDSLQKSAAKPDVRDRTWGGLQHLNGLYNPVGQQRGGLLRVLARAAPGRDRRDPVLAGVAAGPVLTHPVIAGYVAGTLIVRLGSEARESDSEDATAAVERIRTTIAPLLSGLGDRLFFGGLGPVLSLIGILSAILWFGEPGLWYWLGYNSIQVYWRRRSWKIGLRGEDAVRREILGRDLERWVSRLSRLGRFLVGVTTGTVVMGLWAGQGMAWSGVFLLLCAAGFVLSRSGRISPLLFGWIALAASGLIALARIGLGKGTL